MPGRMGGMNSSKSVEKPKDFYKTLKRLIKYGINSLRNIL